MSAHSTSSIYDIPLHVWFISEGTDFLEIEVPKPYTHSDDILNVAFNSRATIIDTGKEGAVDGGRILRLKGSVEDVQELVNDISQMIEDEIMKSRKPYSKKAIAFIRTYYTDMEREKSGGKSINQESIEKLVQEEIESRNQVLKENPLGDVYTKAHY